MSATLSMVPAPVVGSPVQWWPTLHLKQGRKLQAVTLAQCAVVATEYRNRAMADGRGASETPPIKLYDSGGAMVARIYWNGRIESVEGMVIP